MEIVRQEAKVDEHDLSDILEFMRDKHQTLKNDYKTPDGQHSEACSLIARDIAKMLFEKGERPQIISITGLSENKPGIISNEPLVPLQFEGRVEWGGHTICANKGIVYDPILEGPIPLHDYSSIVFGTDVIFRTEISSSEIGEFIER